MKLKTPERTLLLLDWIASFLTIPLAFSLYFFPAGKVIEYAPVLIYMLVVTAIVDPLVHHGLGLYKKNLTGRETLSRLCLVSTVSSTVTASLIFGLYTTDYINIFPFGVLVIEWLLAILANGALRMHFRSENNFLASVKPGDLEIALCKPKQLRGYWSSFSHFTFPKPSPFSADLQRRVGRWLFAFGLVLFFMGTMMNLLVPMVYRVTPPSPSDSYSYIVKGTQAIECPLQDCIALQDLKEQFEFPLEDANLQSIQTKALGLNQGFAVPLHSYLLAGLYQLGLSWEATFNVLTLLGGLLIVGSVAFWLWEMLGPGAAGISLALLSLMVFDRKGLNQITPGQIALGLGVLQWALILYKKNLSLWLLGVLAIASMAFHPIGRVYTAISLGVFIAIRYWQRLRGFRIWAGALLVTTLIILAFIIPEIITSPQLAFVEFRAKPDQTFGENFVEVLFGMADVLIIWGNGIRSSLLQVLLILLGLFSLPKDKRAKTTLMGAILMGAHFVSLFYLLPRAGTLTGRLWIAGTAYFTGLMGRAVYICALFVANEIRRLKYKGIRAASLPAIAAFLSTLLISAQIATHFSHYANLYILFLSNATTKSDVNYDLQQVTIMKSNIQKDEAILYQDIGSMLYFQTHGTLNHHSVFAPVVIDTPQEDLWLSNIRYIVAKNPLNELPNARKGKLILDQTNQMQLEFEESVFKFQLFIENQNQDSVLKISSNEESISVEIEIPGGQLGWIEVEVLSQPVSSFTLETTGALLLSGFRLDSGQSSYWPWNSSTQFHFHSVDSSREDASASFENWTMFDRPIKIIADHGSSVLAEVFLEP